MNFCQRQHSLALPALRFSRLINQTASGRLDRISILINITRPWPTRWFWIYVMKLAELIKVSAPKIRSTNGLKNAPKGLLMSPKQNSSDVGVRCKVCSHLDHDWRKWFLIS